jgi:hypothetical protein
MQYSSEYDINMDRRKKYLLKIGFVLPTLRVRRFNTLHYSWISLPEIDNNLEVKLKTNWKICPIIIYLS